MALIRYNRYPGRFASATSNYPQGAFKNKSGPDALDGSYAEADWLNDWDGFFGRLLTQAGISANGTVDSAQSSQYYDALAKLFPLASLFTGDMGTPGNIVLPITINGSIVKVYLQWAAWNGTTGSTGTDGVFETPAGVYTGWKTAFPNKCIIALPMVFDVSGTGLQETAWPTNTSQQGVTILASCRKASAAMNGMVLSIGY